MTIFRMQSKKIVLAIFTLVSLGVTVTALSDDASTAAGTAASTATSTAGSTASGASGDYLQEIAQYTNATMTAVNTLPAALVQAVAYMLAWTQADTSDATAAIQSTFSTYNTDLQTSETAQAALISQFNTDYFTGATTTNLPNANDLTYGTILGSPFFPTDPRVQNGGPAINSAYNYVKNASGLSIPHVIPNAAWGGTKSDQQSYQAFYNTVSAVSNYNAYLVGQLMTDAQNGVPSTQATLLQQAGSSDWFAQVASESIGIVLRQLLLYGSQSYVLLSQLLQTEKQLLTAQAMTNTLIIANGNFNESTLLRNAVAKSPSSSQ